MVGRPTTLSWTNLEVLASGEGGGVSAHLVGSRGGRRHHPHVLKAMVVWAVTSSSRPSAPIMGVG